MYIDRKINRGQHCDIAMSNANAVLGCGLTTTGIFFCPVLGINAKKNAKRMQPQMLCEENHIL